MLSNDLDILGVTFDFKITFEKHYYYYFKCLTSLDDSKPIQKRICVNHEGSATYYYIVVIIVA